MTDIRGLQPREQRWAIGVTGAVLAPHAFHLNPWQSGFFLGVLLLALLRQGRGGALCSRWILLILTLAGLALVSAQAASLFSREGGVALLSVMMGLKALEMGSRRDLTLLCLLGYFVVITQFLYDKSIGLVVYLALVVWALTALLGHASRASGRGPRGRDLRLAGAMLVQSLPIMVVLFILFPRLDRPLWTLGVDQETSVSGLSDRLAPGSVSNLVQSEEIAFRVEFVGDPPPVGQRYFRGPVFWRTDGLNWIGVSLDDSAPEEIDFTGAVRHRVTLEPSGTRWLLALDYPLIPPPGARLSADGRLLTGRPVGERRSYDAVSVAAPPGGALPGPQRRLALQLPESVTPRMRALANGWRVRSIDPQAVIARGLKYFNTQPFVYTLTPPVLGNNPVDEFLFETRAGFCEHFATSFTLLMRLAGLPCRVVTGYQGGEMNETGGYLVVRQSDAHAWSEVWVEGKGWVRVDPTAAVAPARIERPIDPVASGDQGAIRFRVEDDSLLGRLLRELQWGVDSLSLSWHYWVVGYSRARQSQLLQTLGLDFLRGSALGIAAIVAGLSVPAVLAIGLIRQPCGRVDPARRLYDRFCHRLASRTGLKRLPTEGPWEFARRATRSRPDLATEIGAITAAYVSVRYGRNPSAEGMRRLRQMTKNLST
jgi:transglutaminase-like putative cysteine protease